MTEDTNTSGLSSFLDGKAPCPGQLQEGNFEEFIRNRYSHYADYITYEDMLHLWDCESDRYLATLSTRDRIAHREKQMDILDKIDLEAVHDKLRCKLIDLRHSKPKKHASYELGPREFTFTYSPQWFSDEEARELMKTAVEKLCRYYKDDIITLRAVGEVGKNGLSHIHCMYHLKNGCKITDKNFKRAYPPWDTKIRTGPTGHKGGHHATIRNMADFSGYIEKELDAAWLNIKIMSDDPQNGVS